MFAGSLDRRLEWQRATGVTVDGTGGEAKTWTRLFETWCCKAAARGLELVQSMESTEEEVTVLQFRWRPDLQVTDRVVFEGRTWNIQGLTEIGRRDGYEVTLKTRKDAGQVEG